MEPRDLLLTLTIRYQGEWNSIYRALKEKEKVSQEEIYKAYSLIQCPFISILDEKFPPYLSGFRRPPFILFYYGDISLLDTPYRLTCVGTRNPTVYQESKSFELIQEAEEQFQSKLVIVSGMAHGIDQACMQAAMECHAPIISVIGSGIDAPYPSNNNGIYDYCKEGKGLILSEYPLQTKAQPKNFVFRNRLLSAIGQVIYIGGAKKASGTATTVSFALEMGKEVICLPCNVTGDDLTNSLIHDGSKPVLDVQDIVDCFTLYKKETKENIS